MRSGAAARSIVARPGGESSGSAMAGSHGGVSQNGVPASGHAIAASSSSALYALPRGSAVPELLLPLACSGALAASGAGCASR
jgi:hypothetical protein